MAGQGQDKECWMIRLKTFIVSQKCALEKQSPGRNRLRIKLHLPGGCPQSYDSTLVGLEGSGGETPVGGEGWPAGL